MVGFVLKYIRVLVLSLLGSVVAAAANKGPAYVPGPSGRLSIVLQMPKGFDAARDKCPIVVIMHGVMSNKSMTPMSRIARKLRRNGYAVLRFDFNAHGGSEGDVLKCTIPSEIADARAIYEYARSLPFVSSVLLLGHSQGGVVAGMLAGELAAEGLGPEALVLLAPGAVLKDYALQGRFMGKKCDPENPPEYVRIGWYKFSREYIKTAQTLPIFEESAQYQGPVCVIHGNSDELVPFRYGKMYEDIYRNCMFFEIPGENHLFSNYPNELTDSILTFLHSL